MEQTAHDTLMWMLDGYTKAMLGVAARLTIPDKLANGPQSGDDLARESGQHPESLTRMMRALAARGVFRETPDGRFALTPASELLRSGVPGSLLATAVWRNTEHYALNLKWLPNTIATGTPASQAAMGKSFFEHLADNPAELATFTNLMASGANPGVIGNRHVLAAETGAFEGAGVVVDIAGGRGQLLAEVLRRNPAARGILLDRPEVVATANPLLEVAGVAGRIELLAGDFFQEIPRGGDIYSLSLIMHDWYEPECLAILRNIHAAATPGARVLIIERVLPAPGETSDSFDHDTTQDINMMVGVGGMERTEAEYRTLLEKAGFEWVRDWPTGSPMHVLEGRKR